MLRSAIAASGSEFALITFLGGQVPGEVPGQPGQIDHVGKSACSLSSCCCAGSLARNADGIGAGFPVVSAAIMQRMPNPIERDVRAGHLHHLRSPPAVPV